MVLLGVLQELRLHLCVVEAVSWLGNSAVDLPVGRLVSSFAKRHAEQVLALDAGHVAAVAYAQQKS